MRLDEAGRGSEKTFWAAGSWSDCEEGGMGEREARAGLRQPARGEEFGRGAGRCGCVTLGLLPSSSGPHLPPGYIAEVETGELRAPSCSGIGSV